MEIKPNKQSQAPQRNQPKPIGQSPYDYLRKEQSSAPGWSWRLFSFSILLLIIASVAYLGIEFGYRPYLNSRISAIDDELSRIASEIPLDQQESFVNFYSQALHIQTLLDDHDFFSPLFALLEQHVQSNVFYTTLEYEASENKLALEGIADSFQDLGAQMTRIDELEAINRALISESRSTEEGISFRLILYPSEDLFALNSLEEESPQVLKDETFEEESDPEGDAEGGAEEGQVDTGETIENEEL